jgi:hypothetical protein
MSEPTVLPPANLPAGHHCRVDDLTYTNVHDWYRDHVGHVPVQAAAGLDRYMRAHGCTFAEAFITLTGPRGLHTGEVERFGTGLGGIAVHIGARIASLADRGETLVSSTVRDLTAGSGLAFEDRGLVTLKGVPEAWRVYAVI